MMRLPNALWYFVVLIALPLLFVIIPAVLKGRTVAQRIICENNIKTLSKVMIIYSGGYYDGLLPFPPEKWCDILLGIESFENKHDLSTDTFCCPTDPKGSFSYAVNENLYKKKWTALADASVVLIFESNLGRNRMGGPDDVVLHHNKDGQLGCHIIFADGHIEFVTEDRIADLQWTVKSPEENE